MKRYIARLFGVLALVALAVTACTPPPDEGGEGQTPEVVFPEQITADVTPGEIYTLTFEAPVKWEVSVPAETAAWFRLLDGENTVLSLRGTETGTQQVQIKVTDVTDYTQIHTCNVSLTMDGRTEVVAVLTLAVAQRDASVRVAEYSEADNYFAMDSTGMYVYGEQLVEKVDMRWINSQFMQRVAVTANFNWSLVGEIPAWLTLSATSGAEGVTEISMRTVIEELPLEPTTVPFVISDYTDAENPVEVANFEINFQGCAKVHTWDMNYTLKFNTLGDYYDPLALTYLPTAATGNVIAPNGVVFYTVVKMGEKLYHDRYSSWFTLTVGDYPEGADQKGVYARPVSVKVSANTDTRERVAYILALPADVAAEITDPATQLYTDKSQTAIAYDLRNYIMSVIEQEPYVPPGVIDATDISSMRAYNADFEELENAEFISGAWAAIPNAYRLSYKTADSGDFLNFNTPFSRYEVFGYNGADDMFGAADECWISLVAHAEIPDCYKVVMNDKLNTKPGPEGENVAYIVFYNSENVAYAVVECVLDENFVAPPVYEVDTSAVAFIGEETFDATIEFLTPSDPDWDTAYPNVIQVRLTHRNAMASYVGMKLPAFKTWRSTQSWLKVIQNAGLPCVSMMDLSGNSGRGVITFYDENNTAVLIMHCVFGFLG